MMRDRCTPRLLLVALSAIAATLVLTRPLAFAASCPTSLRFEPTGFGTSDIGWRGFLQDLTILGPTFDLAVSCPVSTPPCGTCTLTGLAPNPRWQRCQNDTAVACTPATEAADCGVGNVCVTYLAPPTSMRVSGIPFCYWAWTFGAVSGSVDVESGAFAPVVPVFGALRPGAVSSPLGNGFNQGCARCFGDAVANDGVRDGTCDAGPRTGLGCDANATAVTIDFGATSFDCPSAADGSLIPIALAPIASTTGTLSRSLGLASPRCTDVGVGTVPCFCATCNDVAQEVCSSNADCPPSGGNPGICGGKICLNGPNYGAPCVSQSECQPGICGRFSEPTRPNGCTDGVCTDAGGGKGQCLQGPLELACTNHPNRYCLNDADCDDVTGACVARPLSCFPDNGLDGAAITVAGTATAPINGVAAPTDLGALVCAPPRSEGVLNYLFGLPGLSRAHFSGRLLFDPAPSPTPPPGILPTPHPTPLPVACPAEPALCRPALVSGKSTLSVFAGGGSKDQLKWKWSRGAATVLADYGDPQTTASYAVCVYVGGGLETALRVPSGGTCGSKPCWRARPNGFAYRSKSGSPSGIAQVTLRAGADGKAQIDVKGKGTALSLPDLATLTSGAIEVQIRNRESGLCWGTTFSPPFDSLRADRLRDHGD